jgi:predicted ATPase
MRLEFKKPHLSVRSLASVNLPAFTILTGVNGSGKSHLLQAIAARYVGVVDSPDAHIVLFDNERFKLGNESQISPYQMANERAGAWKFFSEGNNQVKIQQQLRSFRNLLGTGAEALEEISRDRAVPVWHLSKSEGLDDQQQEVLRQYKTQVTQFFAANQHVKGNAQAQSIFVMIKKSYELLDNISEGVFLRLYQPYNLIDNFLPTQLSRTFADYYSKLEQNKYNEFKNDDDNGKRDVLPAEEFERIHGPKPWNAINKILSSLGTMPYRINSPEGLDRDDQFIAILCDETDHTIKPQFNELSSGERVLMALVASVYKSSSDRHFPDILLLDEIDASLHPSMMRNMLSVIQDVFLSHGVQCVLVTHSPTTVALAPDDSVFIMERAGNDRIRKASRSEALDILTEGFATLDEGLRLMDEVAKEKVSVLTEGRNAAYIRRALSYAGVSGAKVLDGLENISGESQLRTIYDFFCVMPHNRRVVIVWDCDASKARSLAARDNTYPFVFEGNPENSIAERGIENLFDEHLFEGLVTEVRHPDGRIEKSLPSNRKKALEERILDRNDSNDFLRFQPLVDFVRQLAA